MSYVKMCFEIYKATKGMIEIKKSVDEETFNKMLKIFNDKYPEIEIIKAIDCVCLFNYEIMLISAYELRDMYTPKNNKLQKSLKKYKLIISQLIKLVFNLYTINPNYCIFRHWRNHNNENEDFQLPKRRKLFNEDNVINTIDFFQSLYYTCSITNIIKIKSEIQI